MLGMLLFFVIYLCLLLTDAATFFLLIRLIAKFVRVKPLLFLDKVGEVGVEAVTDAIIARTGHWFKKPLTRNQEYAFTFCLLALARGLLGAVLPAFR